MVEEPDPFTARGGAEVLDPHALELLHGIGARLGRNVLAELAEIYLATAPRTMAAIDIAMARSDPAGVAVAAHTLKGSSAGLGALRLADACRRLEQHLDVDEQRRTLVEEVRRELRLATEALAQFVSR